MEPENRRFLLETIIFRFHATISAKKQADSHDVVLFEGGTRYESHFADDQ